MFNSSPAKPHGAMDFSMFGSVADQAKARLASRGLTPEDVKAGRGVTTPDQIKFDDPERVNGGYLGGLVGSLKPDVAETVANAILPVGGPMVVRSYRAATNLPQHPDAVDVTSAALKTAGLPDYAGISRESYHRGEANQSRADMYGAATPPVALAAAGAAAKMLPEGAISETAGHASYGKIFGADADPAAVDAVVPRLVAERRIVGNVDDLAQHGARIEQAAKDAAPAGRLVARPPGSDAPPVLHAADGSPLVEAPHVPGPDEQFGSTLRTLAENAPQSKGGTVGGLVSAGVGYIAHKLLPGNWFIPGAAEAVGAAKLGKAVFTSPLFRTTLGVVKNSFANALRTGDTTTALGIAAKIAGGQNLDDQFGHDRAVYGAVDNAYAQADGNASVARQILHGQEAVYVNPDGSEVAVPGHVVRSFVNALPSTDLQHSDSGMAQSDAQGGQATDGRQAVVPAAPVMRGAAR